MPSSVKSSPFWQQAAQRATERHGPGLIEQGEQARQEQRRRVVEEAAASTLAHFRSVTEYSPAQRHIYFDSAGNKYRVFPKGRRLGATRGGAHAFIEWMLMGWPLLWGDTINANIDRYVERYFMPALKKAALTDWHWNSQKRMLRVGPGYTDFRSADRPENWEGFGYRRVFLNEAGIIMADPYLLTNAVMPMMLDYPDSELIAAGTPKGKFGKGGTEHLYYTFYKRARAGETGYHTKTFSSFDNPWLDAEGIRELTETYGGVETPAARQEIFGEFLDLADDAWQVIPRAWVLLAQERWKAGVGRPLLDQAPDQIGADPARGGADNTVVARRFEEWFSEVTVTPGRLTPTGQHVAALILPICGPHTLVQIDLGAVGSSPVDFTQASHKNTRGINFGTPCKLTDKSGRLRMRNYRAAMYWRLRELLDPSGGHEVALPPDELLMEELTAHTFLIGGQGVQVAEKELVKKLLGRSPDRADAVVLAAFRLPSREVFDPGTVSFGLGETGNTY